MIGSWQNGYWHFTLGLGKMQRLFSGIQPSGRIHLGNYLGAVKDWVALCSKFDRPLYCIVDLHALTSFSRNEKLQTSSDRLKENSFHLASSLLACGLDINNCELFVQSSVPFHAHLQWILSTRTPLSWLELMTQFKSKVKESGECKNNLGLFSYPVLMASDILLVCIQSSQY